MIWGTPPSQNRKTRTAAKCTRVNADSTARGICDGPAGFCGGPAGRLGFAVARLAGWVLGQTKICAFPRKMKGPTGPSLWRLLGARRTTGQQPTHTPGAASIEARPPRADSNNHRRHRRPIAATTLASGALQKSGCQIGRPSRIHDRTTAPRTTRPIVGHSFDALALFL